MIKSVRVAVTAAFAAPLLAAVFAAPANAAADDVTLTADVQGNDVEVTIANDSPGPIVCSWFPTNDDPDDPTLLVATLVEPGGEDRTAAAFDDGSHQISWWCASLLGPEFWGTGELLPTATADPFPFTTPVSAADDGAGSGSGSLGSADSGSLGSLEYGSAEYGSLASLEYGSLASLEYGSLEGVLGFSS
ncbi:hypothetical protein [Rhodococcus spongiicola]|uniref:hypothetical protein n=1 Tax=Rhodococcus spongiicola TaxID=2487352 RepID=UPI000FDD3839|nr:hypothetical protein [Rhodococcus spongiicola]